jgi:FkbM family methyltransferase
MFGGGKKAVPTVNNRLRRAQALRQKRVVKTPPTAAASSAGVGSSSYSKTTSSPTPVTKPSTNANEDDETLVVSGLCTLVCAFFIVCLGAGVATLFFMIHQPECMQNLKHSYSMMPDAKTFASPDVQATAKTAATAAKSAAVDGDSNLRRHLTKVIVPTTTTGGASFVPPQCTTEQLAQVAKQLPAGGCEANKNKAWVREPCSFSAATTCADPTWMRDYYAQQDFSTKDQGFVGVVVGCNKGYTALDLLQTSTKQSKYQWNKWQTSFLSQTTDEVQDRSQNCPKQAAVAAAGAEHSNAKVYCLEPVPNTFELLQSTKVAMGIGDELVLEQVALAKTAGTTRVSTKDKIGIEGVGFTNWNKSCGANVPMGDPACVDVQVDTLDHWINTKTDLAPDAPIHYLSVGTEGHDYEVLAGSAKTLNRVHYIDLTYHWFGHWSQESLKDLTARLQKKNFACYWAGSDQNLWRITDCWQEHYEYQFWANIACVNTEIAGPLAQTMEDLFQATLKKNLQFGEA